jgi:hypothetical protein
MENQSVQYELSTQGSLLFQDNSTQSMLDYESISNLIAVGKFFYQKQTNNIANTILLIKLECYRIKIIIARYGRIKIIIAFPSSSHVLYGRCCILAMLPKNACKCIISGAT